VSEPEDEALRLANLAVAQNSATWARFLASAQAFHWLFALAAPHLFRGMSRVPPREHLLEMVDVFIDRAQRGDRNDGATFEPVPYEQREPLARRLRSLLAVWMPPDLSPEIVETARALIHADGHDAPPGGWDTATIEGDDPFEDILLWPEGVPAILRGRAKDGSEG